MKFKLPTGGASEKPGALDLTDGETALHTVKNGAKDRNSHVLTSSANAKKPQQYLITNLTVTAETDLDSVDTWGRLAKYSEAVPRRDRGGFCHLAWAVCAHI